jgi:hypothetical protein
MSVESSCRKYLDAIARQVAIFYDFPTRYRNPTMGDVLQALDNNLAIAKRKRVEEETTHKTAKRKRDEKETTHKTEETSLRKFFTPAEWKELRELNRDTTNRIHDARMHVTSSGKPIIVLPHGKFQRRRITNLQKIAKTSGLVMDLDEIIVKDEQNISGSSSSSSSEFPIVFSSMS